MNTPAEICHTRPVIPAAPQIELASSPKRARGLRQSIRSSTPNGHQAGRSCRSWRDVLHHEHCAANAIGVGHDVLERRRPRRQAPPPGYQQTRIKQLGQVEHVHHAGKEPLAATLQAKRLDISNMFEPRNQNPKPSNHRSRQLQKCRQPALTTPTNCTQPPSSLTTKFEPSQSPNTKQSLHSNCQHDAANQLDNTTPTTPRPPSSLTTENFSVSREMTTVMAALKSLRQAAWRYAHDTAAHVYPKCTRPPSSLMAECNHRPCQAAWQ